ncbi:hypothetical protein ABN763_16275 [Spongiivirga sp. MCCC 1A20706]|uniref:hypothetical protein n=1 Tax=Spongiivirga sp. MCCC 1A20706 TaxID=3160963 RepID=UPI0039775CE5
MTKTNTYIISLFVLLLHFSISCSEEDTGPTEDSQEEAVDNNDPNDGGNDNGDNNDGNSNNAGNDENQTAINLEAKPEYLVDQSGAQQWGDFVTLNAFKIDGSPAQIVYDTQFQDKGFGIKGARWDQIDFYKMYQGEEVNASEVLEITFVSGVNNVVITVGMMGLNEGIGDDDETGKWSGFDANGVKIAEGVLGPDESNLGPEVKIGGYGQYPFDLNADQPLFKIIIEATGFGYGEGDPKNVNSYDNESGNKENNSDFNIMALSFTKANE